MNQTTSLAVTQMRTCRSSAGQKTYKVSCQFNKVQSRYLSIQRICLMSVGFITANLLNFRHNSLKCRRRGKGLKKVTSFLKSQDLSLRKRRIYRLMSKYKIRCLRGPYLNHPMSGSFKIINQSTLRIIFPTSKILILRI